MQQELRQSDLSPLDRSWWSALTSALLLILFGAAVLAIFFGAAAPLSSRAEKYLPLANGVTQSYRILTREGRVLYASRNTVRLPTNALRGLALDAFAVLIKATGLPTLDRTATLNALHRLDVVRMTFTLYDVTGTFTPTVGLLLVEPERIRQLTVNQLVFDPPLTLFDLRDTPGTQHTLSGTFANGVPYQITTTFDGWEGTDTPLGRLDDCIRIREQFQFGAQSRVARLWLCAGVGVAREEDGEPGAAPDERMELIGASTPALVKALAPLIPIPAGDDTRAELRDVFPQTVGGTLQPLWEYKEEYESEGITTPPLPVGNWLLFGTGNGALVALAREAREPRWRFQTGGGIYGAPVVANGIVYVGSADRKLYALNLRTGAFLWAFATRDAILASPTIVGDRVYVTSEDRTLYALEARSGELRWQFQTGGPIVTKPIVSEGVVYVGSDDGAVYALDAATGQVRWAFATEDAVTAPVTVANGLVYVGSHDKKVYALKTNPTRAGGEMLWSTDVLDNVTHAPVVAHGRVYVTVGDGVRALDATSGAPVWHYATPLARYGGLLVMGDTVVMTRAHDVIVLDAHTGAERGITAVADVSINASVSSDGAELYLAHFDGLLKVFGGKQP